MRAVGAVFRLMPWGYATDGPLRGQKGLENRVFCIGSGLFMATSP